MADSYINELIVETRRHQHLWKKQEDKQPIKNILYKEVSQSQIDIVEVSPKEGSTQELERLKEENERLKKLLEVKDRVIAGLEEFNKQSLFGIGYEDTMSMV